MKGFARMLNSTHLSHSFELLILLQFLSPQRNCWLDDAASLYCKTNTAKRNKGKGSNLMSFARRLVSCVGALFPLVYPELFLNPG